MNTKIITKEELLGIEEIRTIISEKSLLVRTTTSEDMTISIYDDEDVEIEKKGSTIFLTSRGGFISYVFSWLRSRKHQIIVEIPRSLLLTLSCDNSLCTLEVNNIAVKSFRLNTTNSWVSVREVDAKESSSITTSNGKITMERVSCEENLFLRTSNSGVYLDKVSARKEIRAKTSNATVKTYDVLANYIDFSTSNGRIESLKLDADQIFTKSSNAIINLDILGQQREYHVYTTTTNGTCNIANNDIIANKEVSAVTSNGNIRIHFIKN